MDNYIEIIQQNNFVFENTTTDEIINKGNIIIQNGIGDLTLASLLIKNNIIKCPIYNNIHFYISNMYDVNNIFTRFLFNIQLLKKLNTNIIFYNDPNISYSEWTPKLKYLSTIDNLQKYFNFDRIINDEYIIFHTKCRFHSSFDYNSLKGCIKEFCKNFISKYKIILLGERIIPNNFESRVHKITTIYNELLELKNNNEIIDLTKENIYDNLNFEDYLKDISLIHYANNNISVGHGGQFVSCLLFSKKFISFITPEIVPQDIFPKELYSKNLFYDWNVFSKII